MFKIVDFSGVARRLTKTNDVYDETSYQEYEIIDNAPRLKFSSIDNRFHLTVDGQIYDLQRTKVIPIVVEDDEIRFSNICSRDEVMILATEDNAIFHMFMRDNVARVNLIDTQASQFITIGLNDTPCYVKNNQIHIIYVDDGNQINVIPYPLDSPVISCRDGAIILEKSIVVPHSSGCTTIPLLGDYSNQGREYKFIGCSTFTTTTPALSVIAVIEEVNGELKACYTSIQNRRNTLTIKHLYPTSNEILKLMHYMVPFVKVFTINYRLALINKNGQVITIGNEYAANCIKIPLPFFRNPSRSKNANKM
jgi:hypothetical protein